MLLLVLTMGTYRYMLRKQDFGAALGLPSVRHDNVQAGVVVIGIR